MLKFSNSGNAKLKDIISFSIASGWSCPFADRCVSKADPVTGKITDGPKTEFRCFSASQEALYPAVRKQRFHNFQLLRNVRNVEEMTSMINSALPKVNRKGKGKIVRLHVGGDFFSQTYFDAWLEVARLNPDRIFYAYTKSLQYWVNRLGQIPSNFKLNASVGGKQDELIKLYNLKFAEVCYSEQEAAEKGLEIDHDDTHAYAQEESFALLIHGTQPKGSKAAKAKSELAKQGWTGYKKKTGREKINN
jgi:Gene product 88